MKTRRETYDDDDAIGKHYIFEKQRIQHTRKGNSLWLRNKNQYLTFFIFLPNTTSTLNKGCTLNFFCMDDIIWTSILHTCQVEIVDFIDIVNRCDEFMLEEFEKKKRTNLFFQKRLINNEWKFFIRIFIIFSINCLFCYWFSIYHVSHCLGCFN